MTHLITLDSLGKDHIQQFSNRYLHAIAHLDLPSHPTFASKKWPKILPIPRWGTMLVDKSTHHGMGLNCQLIDPTGDEPFPSRHDPCHIDDLLKTTRKRHRSEIA